MATRRFGVVGAGIIGLAVARRLTELFPDDTVLVFDKESDIAQHQSSHNSGVVHAGLYYPPGSLKATLCTHGRRMLQEYCTDRKLPYVECGKLVVALAPEELPALNAIAERAQGNRIPDLASVGAHRLGELEPHVAGIAGLHSPHTAIVDFGAVARSLRADLETAGGQVTLNSEVIGIGPAKQGGRTVLRTRDEAVEVDTAILCGGLHADRLARLAGGAAEPVIVPFRGEYYRLSAERESLVRGLIYPVPDPRYPFLGVHFTRRVAGGVDVGPNAVLAGAREGYRFRQFSVRDAAQMMAWPGFWVMAGRHWRTGVREMSTSLSKFSYWRQARKYLPELRRADLVRAPAGVRAQALDRDGSLVDDFRITRVGSVLAVRNAPSPAATSSLAIAEHICDELVRGDT